MDADLHRAHADLDERHWWFRGRREVIASVLDRWAPTSADVVVDVGCGAGGLLTVLGRHGRVVAVEGDAGAVALAAERHPEAEVRRGDLPGAIAGLPAADLVTAFDVIEHLDDDVDCLRRMRGLLRPGGRICVTVPAMPSLWSEHDDRNGHRRRYTHETLTAAIDAAGLRVRHQSSFNTLLLPVVAVARTLERRRGPSGRGDFDRSLGPADRVLERVLASERHVVARRRVPVGVSLIAVAEPGP